ncbi:hypothetical protein PG991_012347 [Apiospora marii]|uniref:Uncharacterized protein n=1 Tax=Apiospora marii TaxID=335849 RepID=A0ABR1R9M5_9PEZI
MEQPEAKLVTGNPQTPGHEFPPSNPHDADFYPLLRPYLRGGARHCDTGYLAQILQIWSTQIDPRHTIRVALFEAICRGDEVAVHMLLDAGASPSRRESSDPQFTPLQAASQAGQLGMARRLWDLVGPEGRVDDDPACGLSCLAVAARNGRPELVAFFLDVWDGWTAEERKLSLAGAAAQRWDVCVDVLLDRLVYEQSDLQGALEMVILKRMALGEDETGCLRRKQLGDVTHEELEADVRRRQRRVISRLVDAGADPDGPGRWAKEGRLLPSAASQLDYTACLATLLEKGADPRKSQGSTALHCLLRKGPPSRNHFNFQFQDTPQDRLVATQLLLDHGSSPDATNDAGETPLHLAAQNGSLEQLQLCLSHSQSANAAVRQPSHQGGSPLHYAAASGRDDVVECLLAHGAAADIDLLSRSGWTPLLCALSPGEAKSEAMAIRLCARLLAGGASPRVVTAEGWSALHAVASWRCGPATQYSAHRYDPAAREQFVRFARELIRLGAPLDAEPALLRDPAVTPDMVRGVWGPGSRMSPRAGGAGEGAARSPLGVRCPIRRRWLGLYVPGLWI